MPALISHVQQTRTHSAKLQAAQQKADIAIQQLRQSGDQDVADVLIARYEELKQRHDRLLKLQETASIQGPLTTSTEEEEETTTPQINIEQLEGNRHPYL
ncbi:hypothetical protein C0995_001475 [Termitomyces sp. Mi166|nr:hypothetical protein C0995_001475 [Termitomyces sp. Mi166\